MNFWIFYESLFRVCNFINKDKFKLELSVKELDYIVRKVYENEKFMVIFNKIRRFLFKLYLIVV